MKIQKLFHFYQSRKISRASDAHLRCHPMFRCSTDSYYCSLCLNWTIHFFWKNCWNHWTHFESFSLQSHWNRPCQWTYDRLNFCADSNDRPSASSCRLYVFCPWNFSPGKWKCNKQSRFSNIPIVSDLMFVRLVTFIIHRLLFIFPRTRRLPRFRRTLLFRFLASIFSVLVPIILRIL